MTDRHGLRGDADRLLPGGRWPVTDPKDRLDALGNMVGAQLVPGVLVDELYGLAVEYRRVAAHLRGRLAELEWAGPAPMVPQVGCPACRRWRTGATRPSGMPDGHDPEGCWLAEELGR